MLIPDPGGTEGDHFLVIGQVGSGMYGRVFKAIDRRTGSVFALKQCKDLSEREVDSLSSFDHPNILGYHGVLSGRFLVLDYCEFDLQALLSSRGLPIATARCYMHQLLLALSELHSAGFVHRDIKPPNILVTRGNVVKLGDFGLARKVDNRPMSTLAATPCYRAPEVLLRDRRYGPAVDMWSLACVFFEIATGEMLFRPRSPADVDQLRAIFVICGTPGVDGFFGRVLPSVLEPYLERKLPSEYLGLKDLLMRMLALDPAERATAADAIRHPFFCDSEVGALAPDALPKLDMAEAHGASPPRAPNCCRAATPGLCKPMRVMPPPIAVC